MTDSAETMRAHKHVTLNADGACICRSIPKQPQPDELEAIAEQLQGWADFIDTEAAQSMSVASAAYANGGSLADDLRSAIIAMQAERRGAKS